MKNLFSPQLVDFCESRTQEFDQIPEDRKESLRQLSAYILGKRRLGAPARMTVICTHNSRRSHIGKAWLQAAALWYGIYNFESYSGGTESTAFHENAVAALSRSGIELIRAENGDNPVYLMRFGPTLPGMAMYSKHYEDAPNPMDSFCALIVCDDANKACPTVIGAEARVAIPYPDPKNYDGTDEAAHQYDETNRTIARDMFYVFSVVKNMID